MKKNSMNPSRFKPSVVSGSDKTGLPDPIQEFILFTQIWLENTIAKISVGTETQKHPSTQMPQIVVDPKIP